MATTKTTGKTTRAPAKSTTSRSTTTKRTTTKTAVKKAATTAKTAKPASPDVPAETGSAGAEAAQQGISKLQVGALVNMVAERSGVKRRDAKAAVESTLEILGEAIADGQMLSLPGLGKLKVMRTKKQAKAHVYVTKVRRPIKDVAPTPGDGPEPTVKDPLAEAAE